MKWNEIRKIHPWLPETSAGWHQHTEKEGWVQDTASVDSSVHIDPGVIVCGKTRVHSGRFTDNLEIKRSPLTLTVSKITANENGNEVSLGCFSKTIEEWRGSAGYVARKALGVPKRTVLICELFLKIVEISRYSKRELDMHTKKVNEQMRRILTASDLLAACKAVLPQHLGKEHGERLARAIDKAEGRTI